MERVRVMVHDYDRIKWNYQVLEKEIAVLETRSNKLAVFKPKPDIGEVETGKLYLRHIDNRDR